MPRSSGCMRKSSGPYRLSSCAVVADAKRSRTVLESAGNWAHAPEPAPNSTSTAYVASRTMARVQTPSPRGGSPRGSVRQHPDLTVARCYCTVTTRSEEHTSELQSHVNLVCRLLLEKKKKKQNTRASPSQKLCTA